MSENLFEKHIVPASDKMYRYALSIVREPDTAQDVVQECLMKIWDNRHKLTDIQSPEAWAMRITRNQCFDWVKTNRFTMYTDSDHDRPDQVQADQDLLVQDHLNWLDKVVQTLPDKQREVFHLREVEELPYQDIAEVLSMSLSDVKVNLHRARTKVKEFITKTNAYGIAN